MTRALTWNMKSRLLRDARQRAVVMWTSDLQRQSLKDNAIKCHGLSGFIHWSKLWKTDRQSASLIKLNGNVFLCITNTSLSGCFQPHFRGFGKALVVFCFRCYCVFKMYNMEMSRTTIWKYIFMPVGRKISCLLSKRGCKQDFWLKLWIPMDQFTLEMHATLLTSPLIFLVYSNKFLYSLSFGELQAVMHWNRSDEFEVAVSEWNLSLTSKKAKFLSWLICTASTGSLGAWDSPASLIWVLKNSAIDS